MKSRMIPQAGLLVAVLSATLPAFSQTNTNRAAASASQLSLPLYVARAITYEPGQSLETFRAIEDLIRQSVNDPSLKKLLDYQLGKMLSPIASEETRLFAARHLAVIGSEQSLPDVARLLNSEETVSLGCLALSTSPKGAADELLRSVVVNAQGKVRLQIIHTLG